MSKHDVRFCKCGRIHLIDNNKLDIALEKDKNILLICGGCGDATIIGADIESDLNDPSKDCYMMYSRDFSPYDDATITVLDFEATAHSSGIEEIIYSHGVKVPMMTGRYATDFFNGTFSDRWYPDFYKIQRNNVSVDEIMEFISDYNRDRTTVDMARFIRKTPVEILEEVSHYYIKGFNWKGTEWETKYNS